MEGVLIKTSLVDYPSRVAAAYFLPGCNIRCPYCYNGELVNNTVPREELTSTNRLLSHLEKRKGKLTGLVISGGEPLLHIDSIVDIILQAKAMGYKIKLDTNGLFPDRLKQLFLSKQTSPDYVAIDVKTSLQSYGTVGFTGDAESKIQRSLGVITDRLPASSREVRTVLCPSLIDDSTIRELAAVIPKDMAWYFARFRNTNCLDPKYLDVQPFTEDQMANLVDLANALNCRGFLR